TTGPAGGNGQVVDDVLHAAHIRHQAFHMVLFSAALDGAFQGDDALLAVHLDIAGVDGGIVAQVFADFFQNTLIGSLVAFWTTTPMIGCWLSVLAIRLRSGLPAFGIRRMPQRLVVAFVLVVAL